MPKLEKFGKSLGVFLLLMVAAAIIITSYFRIINWFNQRIDNRVDQHISQLEIPEPIVLHQYLTIDSVEEVALRVPRVRTEEEIRAQIFASPRVQILDREPGPAEGQYWHYHRWHACHCHNILFGDTLFYYLPQWSEEELYTMRMDRDHRYTLCSTHFCGYPTVMPDHVVIRCEDPDCELYRFYQPTWRRRLLHWYYDWPRRRENSDE